MFLPNLFFWLAYQWQWTPEHSALGGDSSGVCAGKPRARGLPRRQQRRGLRALGVGVKPQADSAVHSFSKREWPTLASLNSRAELRRYLTLM